MTKLITGIISTVLGLVFAAQVSAAPITFKTSLENSIIEFTEIDHLGWTPEVQLSTDLGNTEFTLDIGESETFSFFDIYLPVGAGEAELYGELAFEAPETANGAGTGSGEWWSLWVISAGELTWDAQPGLIELADGTSFELVFEELDGIQLGAWETVEATVTLRTAAVPEPGSLALLGLGLVGLGVARRNKQK